MNADEDSLRHLLTN